MGLAHPLTCFGLKCLADTLVVLDLTMEFDPFFRVLELTCGLKFLRALMAKIFKLLAQTV